jgi:outer membrane protein assembly factor BamB
MGVIAVNSLVCALSNARTDPGDRQRIGTAGDWKNTIAVAVIRNQLFTVERDRSLYATNLANGQWKLVGKSKFPQTRFLMTSGQNLYVVSGNGSLYRVNPSTGAKYRLGANGVWKNVIKGSSFNGQLYSVTAKGGLYRTSLTTGRWTKLGKDEFGGTTLILPRE